MQRIESGRLRGRRLLSLPKGVGGLRPTAARVRGAIFDRLGTRVLDARVLDLFAGSGALSFEALSRGARRTTLVDIVPRVIRHCRSQAEALGVEDRVDTVRADALKFLRTEAPTPFDLVLVDPPFATPDVFEPIAQALTRGWLAPMGWVVCERERVRGKSPPVAWPSELKLQVARNYGQAVVEFLQYAAPTAAPRAEGHTP